MLYPSVRRITFFYLVLNSLYAYNAGVVESYNFCHTRLASLGITMSSRFQLSRSLDLDKAIAVFTQAVATRHVNPTGIRVTKETLATTSSNGTLRACVLINYGVHISLQIVSTQGEPVAESLP